MTDNFESATISIPTVETMRPNTGLGYRCCNNVFNDLELPLLQQCVPTMTPGRVDDLVRKNPLQTGINRPVYEQ
jgi:hypothetical protein